MFIKNKRSIPKKYIVIGIIVLIIIIFVIFSFTLKEDRKLNKVESFIRDALVYTEKIVSYPVKFVSGKINDYNELKSVEDRRSFGRLPKQNKSPATGKPIPESNGADI